MLMTKATKVRNKPGVLGVCVGMWAEMAVSSAPTGKPGAGI